MGTYPIQTLSRAEVDALLAACSRRAPTGIRNAAMISTLYRTGLRLGELLALGLADLDGDHGAIVVAHGKGDKYRVVGMDPAGWALLERWLDRRRTLSVPRGAPVFCTLAGAPITQPYVRQMLARKRARAGIEKRVHAHGLRHTHLTELAHEGLPITAIQAQAGHEHLATTERYIRRHAPHELLRLIAQRSWQREGEGASGR